MKNCIIGLIFLGMTSLCFAQNGERDDIKEIELESVIITPLNYTYIKKVQDKNTPQKVKRLENIAARYNITESPVFNGNFEAYEVIFREDGDNNGRIVATYNSEGKIIKSIEKFNDVMLPKPILKNIVKLYPGWAIFSDTYYVKYYSKTDDVSKSYNIQIRKDNMRKNLKIDAEGNVK